MGICGNILGPPKEKTFNCSFIELFNPHKKAFVSLFMSVFMFCYLYKDICFIANTYCAAIGVRIVLTPSPETRPRGNRTPDAEMDRRISNVASMIVDGLSRSEILLQCATEYGVSRSTGDRYIEEAYEHFKENYKPHMQRSAEIAKRRHESIFQKSMKKEDYRTALMALTQLNKIQGLTDNVLMAGLRRSDTNSRKDY